MTRKIALLFIVFAIIVSCGKKGDPMYKESNKKNELKIVLISTV